MLRKPRGVMIRDQSAKTASSAEKEAVDVLKGMAVGVEKVKIMREKEILNKHIQELGKLMARGMTYAEAKKIILDKSWAAK